MELVDDVASAARTFLEGLDDEQAQAVLLPFDEEERRAWAYWPTQRRGIRCGVLAGARLKPRTVWSPPCYRSPPTPAP